jgi:hypothetical protein
MGAGLFLLSFWYVIVRLRALYWSLSPFWPMRLGVAVCPTHSPISKGQRPSLSTFCWRSSSSAQINVAARPNWSSVSSRRV